MKQLLLSLVAALLISVQATAQSRIDKIVDEIEQKGVDVNKVVKRDPQTRKPYLIVRSLTFYSKEGKYAERLRKAFQEEAEKAITETTSRNHYSLIFKDGQKQAIYTMTIKDQKDGNPRVSISITVRDKSIKSGNDFDIDTFSFNNLEGFDLDSILNDGKLKELLDSIGIKIQKDFQDFKILTPKSRVKIKTYGKA